MSIGAVQEEQAHHGFRSRSVDKAGGYTERRESD
jgi:hypothetical protein